MTGQMHSKRETRLNRKSRAPRGIRNRRTCFGNSSNVVSRSRQRVFRICLVPRLALTPDATRQQPRSNVVTSESNSPNARLRRVFEIFFVMCAGARSITASKTGGLGISKPVACGAATLRCGVFETWRQAFTIGNTSSRKPTAGALPKARKEG